MRPAEQTLFPAPPPPSVLDQVASALGEAERLAAKSRQLHQLRAAEVSAAAKSIAGGAGGAAAAAAGARPVRIVLITGFESFNSELYKRAAEMLKLRAGSGVQLKASVCGVCVYVCVCVCVRWEVRCVRVCWESAEVPHSLSLSLSRTHKHTHSLSNAVPPCFHSIHAGLQRQGHHFAAGAGRGGTQRGRRLFRLPAV